MSINLCGNTADWHWIKTWLYLWASVVLCVIKMQNCMLQTWHLLHYHLLKTVYCFIITLQRSHRMAPEYIDTAGRKYQKTNEKERKNEQTYNLSTHLVQPAPLSPLQFIKTWLSVCLSDNFARFARLSDSLKSSYLKTSDIFIVNQSLKINNGKHHDSIYCTMLQPLQLVHF